MTGGSGSPERGLALLAALLIVSAGAGCGPAGEPRGEAPAAAAESEPAAAVEGPIVAEVIDGDTRRPLAGAEVVARAPGGRRTPTRTGEDGRAVVPADTESIRAGGPGLNPDTALVAPPGADGVSARVAVYRSDLQSPVYGGTATRTRHRPVAAPRPEGPPDWTFDAGSLVEFPPAVRNGVAVFGTNHGRITAVDVLTGERRWTRKADGPIASTPAISGGRVFVTSMDGYLTAYTAAGGSRLWRFPTDGPTESSPLIFEDLIIFGDTGGTLRAVRATTGELVWSYRAAGAIKSGAAQAGDLVVVGDYGGAVHAVDARTGAPAWSWSGGQRFYGGPAVADGMVVIGDVGGYVLALDAPTGIERWRRQVDAFVYSSPAVAGGRVYIGSFAGNLEALRLRDGALIWSTPVGGRIGGSATVVGDLVYSSVLFEEGQARRTVAASTQDGRVVWESQAGRYSPAVAAGHTLFLVDVRTISAWHGPGLDGAIS